MGLSWRAAQGGKRMPHPRGSFLSPTRTYERRQAAVFERFPERLEAKLQKEQERVRAKSVVETTSASIRPSAELTSLRDAIAQRSSTLSPLRNRPASVNQEFFTPSRTQSICVAYGSDAFHRRSGRRSDQRAHLPIDNVELRTFADSTLLKKHRDEVSMDERRVVRGPNLLPSQFGRAVGLNGEAGYPEERVGKKSTDVTKFSSLPMDTRAKTQAMIRKGCHRMINVE